MEHPPFHPPEASSPSLNVGAYIFIGVGAVTMLMGFLGCVGAVNEVRCLLGMVSSAPSAWPALSPARPRAGWGAPEGGPGEGF